jgi:hypothetical protein
MVRGRSGGELDVKFAKEQSQSDEISAVIEPLQQRSVPLIANHEVRRRASAHTRTHALHQLRIRHDL